MGRGGCRAGCLFFPASAKFGEPTWRPAVDVYRRRAGWLAKFDLPGVRPQDIEVHVHGRRLAVHGVRKDWTIEAEWCYHSLEITYSPFERVIEFPESLEQAEIHTEYQAGMLLVHIDLEQERP